MEKITLEKMADLYFELIDVETLNRAEVVIHAGRHPEFGDIVIMQWGGDNHAFLNVR